MLSVVKIILWENTQKMLVQVQRISIRTGQSRLLNRKKRRTVTTSRITANEGSANLF